MHVTNPTGIPLNVRGFDGKVIGALHNGKIARILCASAGNRDALVLCYR
jgi:hypothetical protein